MDDKIQKINEQITKGNSVRNEILRLLDNLSEDERHSIFHEYCVHCGNKNPRCHCQDDD